MQKREFFVTVLLILAFVSMPFYENKEIADYQVRLTISHHSLDIYWNDYLTSHREFSLINVGDTFLNYTLSASTINRIPSDLLELQDIPEEESRWDKLGNGILLIIAITNYVNDTLDIPNDDIYFSKTNPPKGLYPVTIHPNTNSLYKVFSTYDWRVWWLTSFAQHPEIEEDKKYSYSSDAKKFIYYRETLKFVSLNDIKNILLQLDKSTNIYDRVGLTIIAHGCSNGLIVPYWDGNRYVDCYIPWSTLRSWLMQIGPALDWVYIAACYSDNFADAYTLDVLDNTTGTVLWTFKQDVTVRTVIETLEAVITNVMNNKAIEYIGDSLMKSELYGGFTQYDYYSDANSDDIWPNRMTKSADSPEDINYSTGDSNGDSSSGGDRNLIVIG